MRLLIAIVSLLFLPLAESMAQEFSLGLKGGLNFANQKIASVPDKISSNTGYHGGASISASLPGGIGFQIDGLLVSQATEWENTNQNSSIDEIKSKLTTLQVPVLLRMNFSVVNIHFGPQFNFIIQGETETRSGTTGQKINEKIKDDLKSGEFGLVLGAGVRLPANFNLTARYIVGLSDISDTPDYTDWKNSMMQVSLGYRLLGNK